MKSYANNAVTNPNRFGSTSEAEVAAFEKIIGSRLPTDYRAYLLEFNGGRFEKREFEGPGDASGCVHNIYGLHAGPEYARLLGRWRLAKYYDIGEIALGVADYLVFASTDTGDLLLIALKSGELFFLDHETIKGDPDFGARFSPVFIAKSFDDFVNSLRAD